MPVIIDFEASSTAAAVSITSLNDTPIYIRTIEIFNRKRRIPLT